MAFLYRFISLGLAAILTSIAIFSTCFAQGVNFAERQSAIKQRLEKSGGKIQNKAVHNPPMIKAAASDLGDDEPVIGVFLNNEARAYPLTMLFGGGGIFELLNDTCGGEPIAASW